jgi:hypothetical protein
MFKKLIWLFWGLTSSIIITIFSVATYRLSHNQAEVLDFVLNEINTKTHGTLRINDLKISPFKSFPYISIDLKQVKFFESKDTTCQPINVFKDVYVGFDLFELLKKEYKVKDLKILNGYLNIAQYKNGTYNIINAFKENKEGDSYESNLNFDIQHIFFKNIDLVYSDWISYRETEILIEKLNAKIRFQQNHFYIDLIMNGRVGVLENDKPTFFVNKKVNLDFELDYNLNAHTIQLLPSTLSLNNAKFLAEGSVDVINDMDLSLKLKGDKPDFGLFAAFLPDEIANELISYKNEGNIFFDGNISGKSINGHIPLINFDFGCEKGYFLNTEAKKKLDELRFIGRFTNGDSGTLETSLLEIKNFHTKPEEGIFLGHLFIKNFINPSIKLDVHADLDLDFLGKFFKIKDFQGLTGRVLIDMDFNEIIDLNFGVSSLAELKRGIDSELRIYDLNFNMPEYGLTITDLNSHVEMRQGAISMDSLTLKINNNDLFIKGTLSDFPAIFHKYDTLINLSIEASSNQLDLKDLLGFKPELAEKIDEVIKDLSIKMSLQTKAKELFDFTYLPQGVFYIDDLNAEFSNYPHKLHDIHADIIISEHDFELIDFSGNIDVSDFHFSGKLFNYPKWFQDKPKGDSQLEFDFTSALFKLNDILTYKGHNYLPESYRDEVFQDSKIKGSLAMHYDSEFKSLDLELNQFSSKLKIHPLKIENLTGKAHYQNDLFVLKNVKGNMGASDFEINMSYFLGDDQQNNELTIHSNALDLDALLGFEDLNVSNDHAVSYNIFSLPFPELKINATIGKLNYHKFWLRNIQTEFRILKNHFIYLDTIAMDIADGSLQMKGYFNGADSSNIYYHSTIHAQNLDLDKLLFKFDNFGQDLVLSENLKGKISGTVESTFKMHPDLTPIIEQSKATMNLLVLDGSLLNFTPMLAMSNYFRDKNLHKIRFDTLINTFELNNGMLTIPNMEINSSIGYIQLSGKQKVDLSMEYFLKVPLKIATRTAWRHIFDSKNTKEIDPEQIDNILQVGDPKRIRFIHLKIEGTPSDYKVSVGREK